MWSCAQALPPTFTLPQIYAFADDLGRGRKKQNVPARIHEQLQNLCRDGKLERVEPGVYRHMDARSATVWPFHVGDRITRADLCDVLGLDAHGLDRKGMHKNSSGRFSRDLLLMHEAGENPYQDRFIGDSVLLWYGQGVPSKGDQRYRGFNRYLAEHVELGIDVHLFVRPDASDPAMEYRGKFMTHDARLVTREAEGRKVLEYELHNTTATRDAVGLLYQHSWERPPEPYVLDVRARTRPADRPARDKAFGSRLMDLYREQCAICGPPTVGKSGLDKRR